jgi:hypothetical protein
VSLFKLQLEEKKGEVELIDVCGGVT